MSRSLTQIYSEAVATRNNYMQLTNMKMENLSSSKLSILNLMTYVMSVLIYSYETILDAFQIDIASFVSSRINGTGPWYAYMATLFQYNPDTELGDTIQINEKTFRPEYAENDASRRIVAKSAYQNGEGDYDIVLKICKLSSDSTTYTPLDNKELAAFIAYMENIKFIGVKIQYISKPGDILTVTGNVYYRAEYTTAEKVFDNIRKNLIKYVGYVDYNGYIYYQQFVDCLNYADGVISVESGVVVTIRSYEFDQYGSPKSINNRTKMLSGYAVFTDEKGNSTINTSNIRLIPLSN